MKPYEENSDATDMAPIPDTAPLQYALSLLTGDGWVVTLVGDKPMTLGDTIVETIIVQPFADYKEGKKIPPTAIRTLYRLNTQGQVVTEELY